MSGTYAKSLISTTTAVDGTDEGILQLPAGGSVTSVDEEHATMIAITLPSRTILALIELTPWRRIEFSVYSRRRLQAMSEAR